jgi:hypothetical protein
MHAPKRRNQVTCHPDPARTVPVLPPCQVTREFIWDASDNRQLVRRARALSVNNLKWSQFNKFHYIYYVGTYVRKYLL